jgi:hypothetical protein
MVWCIRCESKGLITSQTLGKIPSTDDKWEVHQQHLVEALVCSCKHPSVIKFFAIHAKTMEAHTLW